MDWALCLPYEAEVPALDPLSLCGQAVAPAALAALAAAAAGRCGLAAAGVEVWMGVAGVVMATPVLVWKLGSEANLFDGLAGWHTRWPAARYFCHIDTPNHPTQRLPHPRAHTPTHTGPAGTRRRCCGTPRTR